MIAETFEPGPLPTVRQVPVDQVRDRLVGARRMVVLDDDPTGTQTVKDVPVLTRWEVEDLRWAFRQPTPGFFVLTNTRSLSADDAAARNAEVAEACFAAAALEDVDFVFASRSDSTLRGHFPLETDVLAEVSLRHGRAIDAVIISPAYLDAGRVTIDSVHLVRAADGYLPVGTTEFARDSTFGYSNSHLADWVEEKSGGRIARSQVESVTLDTIRAEDPAPLEHAFETPLHSRYVAVDAVVDDDLRAIALAVLAAETAGKRFIYRVGPSFVRARIGQGANAPIDDVSLHELTAGGANGLVVVGSHVGVTTRQLEHLRTRIPFTEFQLDVPKVIDQETAAAHVAEVTGRVVQALETGLVVLSTTRTLVTGSSADESLEFSRRVSAAVSAVVSTVVATKRPAFVVAKGGITSSDVATEGLSIRNAWVRGTLLPGIVSLWVPTSGPAEGLPYVVFAGNVGDDEALAAVVERLQQ